MNYNWDYSSSNLSQSMEIRDSSGNPVVSGSGYGTSGSFTITASGLNPSSTYSIFISSSSYLGATFAVITAYGTINYQTTYQTTRLV